MTGQNYLKGGYVGTFEKRGYKIPGGRDIAIGGDIPPVPAFSSASLEVPDGIMLRDTFGFTRITESGSGIDRPVFLKITLTANCGIMDPVCFSWGKG